MKLEMSSFQAVAANLPVEGEVCDIGYMTLSTRPQAETEIAPLIEKVGATSIAEIDRLIAELQQAKGRLQSERARIEREAIAYVTLTQMASASAKIIFDAVSQWHPAHNQKISDVSEAPAVSAEDNVGAFGESNHHSHGDEPGESDGPKAEPLG
jgi:hypothetical protein